MSIINKIFKNDDADQKTTEAKSSSKSKVVEVKDSGESKKEKKGTTKKSSASSQSDVNNKSIFIKAPWISEKSRDKVSENQYVFLVENNSNKTLIKEEVERKWGVKVQSVNTIRKGVRAKKFGGRPGKTKILKKAIVTLKEGDKIDIYPV